jgi:uncharacterized sporulation protein YeaH/YhbH (DUF444 family)
MAKRILKDLERFKRIVRGEIRKNLKELIETGSIVGQKGSHIVKVPIKAIHLRGRAGAPAHPAQRASPCVEWR